MSHESKSGSGAPWSIHEIMRIRSAHEYATCLCGVENSNTSLKSTRWPRFSEKDLDPYM